ncbi:MAG: folate-binding protein YgfZ [Pseudomonadales bacterium]|nr:folate-binding protein YgfZ [Pseudomonadales bacterium]
MQTWPEFLSACQQAANPERFTPKADAVYAVSSLSIIEIRGTDAESFLQGQLSNDVSAVTSTQSSFASHSTAKGRMLSSGRFFRAEPQCFYYLVDQSIAESSLAALKKYSVFSKVELSIRNDLHCLVVSGSAAEACCSLHTSKASYALEQQFQAGEVLASVIALEPLSLLMIAPSSELLAYISQHQLTEHIADETQLSWLNHQQRLAFVSAPLQDQLIAQMLNYQNNSAISFTKGCYTGQEIIARSQYRGKLKRQLYRAKVTANTAIAVGAQLSIASGNERLSSCGVVASSLVCSQQDSNSWQLDCLLVLTEAAAESDTLFLTEQPSTALTLQLIT